MLFASNRKKATAFATNGLQPLVRTVQRSIGIPRDFWIDPYVLGYFGFAIGHFAKLATNGGIKAVDMGLVLEDVFGALSNMNGQSLRRYYTELAFVDKGDFSLGSDHAAVLMLYSINHLKNENDNPIVQEAIQFARNLSNSPSRENVTTGIFAVSFLHEMKRLFPNSN